MNKILGSVKSESDVTVATLVGSLDVSVQKELRDELEGLAKAQEDIVLECSQVSFLDSSCLGILVSITKSLRDRKGDIKFAALTDDVRSIFQITRLDRIFELYDSVSEAVESYYKS